MWGRGVRAGEVGRRRRSCRVKPACRCLGIGVWLLLSWAVGGLALPGRGGGSRWWTRPAGVRCAAVTARGHVCRGLASPRACALAGGCRRWPLHTPADGHKPRAQRGGPDVDEVRPRTPRQGEGARGRADAVHGPLRTRPQSGIEGGPRTALRASGGAEEKRFALSSARKAQIVFILRTPEVRSSSQKPPCSTWICREAQRRAAGGDSASHAAWGLCPAVSLQLPPRTPTSPGWPCTSGLGCSGGAAAKRWVLSESYLLLCRIVSAQTAAACKFCSIFF